MDDRSLIIGRFLVVTVVMLTNQKGYIIDHFTCCDHSSLLTATKFTSMVGDDGLLFSRFRLIDADILHLRGERLSLLAPCSSLLVAPPQLLF